MLKFTLDTNCLIEVDENRPGARFVERLVNSAKYEIADVAMVASSASERQKSGAYLTSFTIFRSRMDQLGFSHINILPPLLRWDMGFWNHGIWAGREDYAREKEIFDILFPKSAHDWHDYAAAKKLSVDDTESKAYRTWRNKLLDAQAYWAHEYHRRDVFVTNDRNFLRLTTSPSFPDANIMSPEEASRMIDNEIA